MPNTYLALPCMPTGISRECREPPELPELIHITDSAITTFVDFKYHIPPFIAAEKSLDDAKIEMDIFHLPLLLVIDNPSDKNVIGIISSDDILGEKPVKLSQEKRVPRSEIEVGMLMTPIDHTMTVEYEDLLHAKVGHIIQTLRHIKQHLLFALDNTKIRGFFAASIISRQLSMDISQVMSEAQSIAELQHDLHQ